jgi:hypothetical protein
MPVGECKDGDMVNSGNGEPLFWSWCISNGISSGMDSEISSSYPESWNTRILEETFPEDNAENGGL